MGPETIGGCGNFSVLKYKRKPMAVNTFKAAGQTDLALYRLHWRNLHTARTCRCWTHFYYSNFLFMETLDYQEFNHMPLFFSFASLASCPSFIYCLSGCSLGNVNLSVKQLLSVYESRVLFLILYFWQPPYANVYMITLALFKWVKDSDPALFFTAKARLNSWITFTGHTRRLQKWQVFSKKSKKICIYYVEYYNLYNWLLYRECN